MKIIETTFERLPRERLVIGFEGENLRATVRIDCASFFAEYPNATPALIVKPLFADAYPVVVDRNGTDVDWLITSEILSFTGDGEIQLIFYKDQVICKSAVSKIRVCRSLQVTGDMPDPVVQWIENANRKLAEVDAQIVELEGMVDTATDAATRAEQSASTASTKAEQAAGSAATATAKATEATNAAGTATAKAAEAQTAAQTATEKANAAAESERIATAKAGDATTAATTATAKAEQATGAAQTATEKAGDASASARAAQASATDAESSATAASASETAAKASETAAGASATQAAQSAQNAGTAAQTATQKAAEATQSATDAAIFAGTATTKAEEATEAAQAASDAKTAVEETAEQLAESLEQIAQNTQDIAELDERKANIDGYYPDMTVGNAEQLNSSKFVENSEPYTLRTSGGTSDIGNREYLDAVVGGTLAWNQAVRDEASENSTDFAPIVTVTDAVEDAAGVKVKLEPVQDLHGYDHPWPAGGGKNKCNAQNPIVIASAGNIGNTPCVISAGTYTYSATTSANVAFQLSAWTSGGTQLGSWSSPASVTGRHSIAFTISEEAAYIRCYYNGATTISDIQVESGSTATSYEPYSNICPITGWDGVKVTRTGKNLFSNRFSDYSKPVNYYVCPVKLEVGQLYSVSAQLVGTAISGCIIGLAKHGNDYKSFGSFDTLVKSDGGISSYIPKFFTVTSEWDSPKLIVYCSGETQFNQLFENYQIQLELGSTVTDYEPYAGNTYNITLPTEAGTVYGGELTVNADGSGSLVVDRATRTLDGTEPGWAINGSSDHPKRTYGYNKNSSMGEILTATEIVSSYVPSAIFKGNDEVEGIYVDAGYLWIRTAPMAGMTAVVNWTTYLSNNPLQIVYKLTTPLTYTLTASQIRTLLGENNIWADTGDLALTYTGTDEHLTLESGKKYLSRISGTDSMLLGSGQEITAVKGTDNVFDLTQMFGTAVADYVYGQGAGFFRRWFPNARYLYNAGELMSVEGLQSHDMVGFNQFDKDTMVVDGCYIDTDGTVHESVNYKSTDFIPAVGGMSYYINTEQTQGGWGAWYDGNKNYAGPIAYFVGTPLQTAPQNARYMRLTIATSTSGNPDTLCISLSHNGSRNGEYAPYEKHSYPLDSTVILRGIPKVGANGVYWDGDRYLPDGTVERRYGVVDMGTLDWGYHNTQNFFYANIATLSVTTQNLIANDYVYVDKSWAGMVNGEFGKVGNQNQVRFHNDAYTNATAFKAAMQGVFLIYELATPTTETAQPYHSTQWVSDWGTEEFVSTSIVPIGHETRYPQNLRDKLQHLPSLAGLDGKYIISQSGTDMTLVPYESGLPTVPSANGSYVLKCTVTNGVASYSWVAS